MIKVFGTPVLMVALGVPALAFTPQSTVLAGSGQAGFTDGPAASSSFSRPVAIAYAANGDLYVVDQGSQRIRAVGANGVVWTVAGGGSAVRGSDVHGGFRDGPALEARFDSPSGIMVDRDGALLVADAGNHCIRRITRNAVTTFAGTPAKAGTDDGPRATAHFAAPMGISTDGMNGYYVADYGNGLRHISADGIVTKVDVPKLLPSVRSVTAVRTGPLTSVFIAGDQQFFVFRPEQRYAAQLEQDDNSGEPIGLATDVVAIGPHEFLYADPYRHAVRYFVYRDDASGPFDRHYAFPLTGPTPEDAANTGGTLVSGSDVPFVSPVAVALAPNGTVAVADAGNRRIRSLTMVDRRQYASGDIAELQVSDEYYRIAYVSNSTAFRNTTFEDTIGGQLERALNRDRARVGLKKPVKVLIFKLQTGLTATSSYVRELLGDGLVDEVVWGFNGAFLAREVEQFPGEGIPGQSAPEKWQGRYAAIITEMMKGLAARDVGLFVAYFPIAGYQNEPGFIDAQFGSDPRLANEGTMASSGQLFKDDVDRMLDISRVPYADVFSGVWSYEGSVRHGPLYGSEDGHGTPYGNELIAELIAQELERVQPWQRKVR